MPRSRNMFEKPPGRTTLREEALEPSAKEMLREDVISLGSDRFQSRLEQEQQRRQRIRRAAMERASAQTAARSSQKYQMNFIRLCMVNINLVGLNLTSGLIMMIQIIFLVIEKVFGNL